jgi:hypothetical protein
MRCLIASLALFYLLASGPASAGKKSSAVDHWQDPMIFLIVRSNEKGCEPNCPEWLMAEGMITQGSPLAFRKALDLMAGRQLPVVLRSPGGNLVAAVEIGYMVRRAGLSVTVGKTSYKGCALADVKCHLPPEQYGVYRGRAISKGSFCLSACPLILAAGVKRLASPKAIVGVHQIRTYIPQDHAKKTAAAVNLKKLNLSKNRPAMNDFVRNILSSYLTTMGISLALLDDMEKASGENIYKLSSKRLKTLKLVTETGGVETLLARSTK